ncbi:30S ribosomal protein S6 [Bacteroidota bacterium]
MRKNHYESVVIINAALEDDQIENTKANVKESITSNGGEITDMENWGRKRLAYPIQKSKSGYYIVLRFVAPVSLISTLERMYRLDETIIRYLTISLDNRALDYIQKQKEKAEVEPQSIIPSESAKVEKEDVPEKNDENN